MTMRTPMGEVRGLGSTRAGTGHFWWQRLTAVANIPLTLFIVFSIVFHIGTDHAKMAAYLGSPMVTIALFLFIVSSVFHMGLGMSTVIEDYVQHEGLKILGKMASTFFCIVIGFSSLFAVLKLSFGG